MWNINSDLSWGFTYTFVFLFVFQDVVTTFSDRPVIFHELGPAPDSLVISIISIFFCLPFGIVATVKAAEVGKTNDYSFHIRNSEKRKKNQKADRFVLKEDKLFRSCASHCGECLVAWILHLPLPSPGQTSWARDSQFHIYISQLLLTHVSSYNVSGSYE